MNFPIHSAIRGLAVLLAVIPPLSAQEDGPDLLLVGGPIHTLEGDVGQAVTVNRGRIAWVGPAEEGRARAGPKTRVVELGGRPVVPGFHDAHLHLQGLGHALAIIDLVGTTSYEEVVERVRAAAVGRPADAWILGHGWDQNDWEDTDFPRHGPLSEAVPDHPVLLERVDGHAILVNTAALAAAGVDATTDDPEGGRIVRDADGAPTGVFVDRATNLVSAVVPEPTDEELRADIERAIADLHRRGVTAVHDAGVSARVVAVYRAMMGEGALPLDVFVMQEPSEKLIEILPNVPMRSVNPHTPPGRDFPKMRAIKVVADGAMGSRGAALFEDYDDDPGNTGLVVTSKDEIRAIAIACLRGGFQLCVHAIGDRANREVLDAFQEAFAAVPVQRRGTRLEEDVRFRIEHAQALHPDDLPRFAELGVIPSMQALHCTSDSPWVEKRIGDERAAGAYAWRSLLDTGVIIAGGTDAPVEAPDPIASFVAAVTRHGWRTEQAMTRDEALRSLTLWPAHAAFNEHRLGSIKPGKQADLVVLSGDLLTTPEEELADVTVEMTIVRGEVVYER